MKLVNSKVNKTIIKKEILILLNLRKSFLIFYFSVSHVYIKNNKK